jgi:hypothetical protein
VSPGNPRLVAEKVTKISVKQDLEMLGSNESNETGLSVADIWAEGSKRSLLNKH